METHPDNTDFEWHSPEPPFTYLSNAQVESFDKRGFCLVEDVFSREEIHSVMDALDPLEREASDYLRTQHGGRYGISQAEGIVFNPHAVMRDPVLREFARHEVFVGLTRDLIGDDVRLYWDQLVYKKLEADQEFPWHQDNGYTFVVPQQYVTCWVALTDATIENGCPWVLPGEHTRGTLKHRWTDYGFACLEDPEGAVPIEARSGSVVVFSSLTPHCTGPNRTQSIRKAYILQYAPDGTMVYPRDGEPARANHPDRQFEVVRSGKPVD